MAGKIPQAFLDDLLARVDLVELIDARVPLKRLGVNYGACCPFHNEKTPSFTVNRDKQFYHCFGCRAHGNAIDFLMAYERLSFVEAVHSLAQLHGLSVPNQSGPREDDRHNAQLAALYATQAQVSDFYAEQLRLHPQRQRAVDYLKQRGVSGAIAARYRLGYAPPGWDHLLQRFGRAALQDSGLLVEKDDGRAYDRFRDRILFPIRDRRGRTLGFGGRVLDGGEPKYLNSPETALFKKRREVYGLYELLQSRSRAPFILIVEGYMDVVALAQFGIPWAVATLGTATSSEHFELLFRYNSELIFCFDGDAAGQSAAWRALETALPHMRDGRQIRFLTLPAQHDPDSLVRQDGAEAFQTRLSAATPLSDFLLQGLQNGVNLAEAEGQVDVLTRGQALLSKLPDGLFRPIMQQRLNQLAGFTTPSNNAAAVPHAPPYRQQQQSRPEHPASPRPRAAPSLLWNLIVLLLRDGQFVESIDAPLRAWLAAQTRNRAAAHLSALIEALENTPDYSAAAALDALQHTPFAAHLRTAQQQAQQPLPTHVDLKAEFQGAIALLHGKINNRRQAELLAKLDQKQASPTEIAEYRQLMATSAGRR